MCINVAYVGGLTKSVLQLKLFAGRKFLVDVITIIILDLYLS